MAPPPYAANFKPKWTMENHHGLGSRPDLAENYGPFQAGYWEHLPVVYNDPASTETTVGLSDPTIDGVLARVQWAASDDDPNWGRTDLVNSQSYFNGGQNAPGFSFPNISNMNVYDNRLMLLTGRNQWANHNFDVHNIRLKQTFFENKAGVEFAYNAENYAREEHFPGSDRTSIMVDQNERLSNGMVNRTWSWLNMAEIELNVLIGQCLNRRIAQLETVRSEVRAWQRQRDSRKATINWRFTNEKARIKLKRLYPTLDG